MLGKKIISLLTALTLTVSGAISFVGNAHWYNSVESGDEKYQERIKVIEANYPYYPEMDESLYRTKKVWLAPKEGLYGERSFYAERVEYDSLVLIISANNVTDSEIKSVAEKYVSDSKIDVEYIRADYNPYRENITVIIAFKGYDTENNINNSIKITEFMDSNYDVQTSGGGYNRVSFIDGTVNMSKFFIRAAENEEWFAPKEIPSEYSDSINKELEELGMKSYFDAETHKIVYDDEENNPIGLAKVCKYMRENYNAYVLPDIYTSNLDIYSKEITFAKEADEILGDANCDGNVTIADAVAIQQYLANAVKYPLSEQGLINADFDGDGITGADALTIQKMDAAKTIS